jgi:psiF repeat
MPTLLTVLVALVVLLSTVAAAPAAEEKALSPQAQRMKDCNAQAQQRALAGDARKAFMSDCLKGGGAGRTDRSSPGSASPASTTTPGDGAVSEPSSQGGR